MENDDLRIGDIIVVNDNLKEWIYKNGWGSSMLKLIGKELTINDMFLRTNTVGLSFKETEYWIPIQCVKKTFKDNDNFDIKWYKKGKLEK